MSETAVEGGAISPRGTMPYAATQYAFGWAFTAVMLPSGADPKDVALARLENARRHEVARRRVYYEGAQYRHENEDVLRAAGKDPLKDRLPEQDRKHCYATQIEESVNFLADQLAEGFRVEADDAAVQAVIDSVVGATDLLSGKNDDDNDEGLCVDEPLREALMCGDTPVEYRWDPIEGVAYLEFWESENVWFEWESTTRIRRVTRTEVQWEYDDANVQREVLVRHVYEVAMNPALVMEARVQTFWDQEPDPRSEEWLNVPFLPWALLRGWTRGLRPGRGVSLITQQCMEHADRYNATEQTGYLIARYNSHGNLVVIGDAASLKLEADGRVNKDVADVLTFPGGTSAQALTLPTDATMLNSQRATLANAMYATFGLVRVEPDTVAELGPVSGYALEILNRKTEGTFRRIRRQWRKDWKALVDGLLDFVAYKQGSRVAVLDLATYQMLDVLADDPDAMLPDLTESQIPITVWWDTDPSTVFPNRDMEIRMGSGYVVDDIMVRDDFVAKMVSIDEALRLRGYDDDEIKKIKDELKASAPPPPEVSPNTAAALAALGGKTGPVPGSTGTQAGRTLSAAGGAGGR